MKLKNIILTILSLQISTISKAQTIIKPLEIGDRMPDIEFKNTVNFPQNISRLSDLKGKLIILDYWNRWCTTCISSFPKFDKIQDDFNGKIQIILVTDDTHSELSKLKNISTNVKNTKLPILVEDSIIKRLFPHRIVPFLIWIDGNGIVRYKTDAYNATHEHISNLLAGKNVNMALRDDKLRSTNTSFLTEKQLEEPNFPKYTSNIIGSIPGAGVKELAIKDSISKDLKGVRIYNYGILDLFSRAYSIDKIFIILKSTRLEKLLRPTDDNKIDGWNSESRFCYESQIDSKLYSYKDFKSHMQKDLNTYFKTTSEKRKQTLKCLVLTNKGISRKLLTKLNARNGTQIAEKTAEGYNFKYSYLNGMISIMRNDLLSEIGPIPIINETNFNERIDLELNVRSKTLVEINSSLEKIGLQFIIENREFETLTIKDKESLLSQL